MNVIVLCTGRCGSVTFIKAAKHISNFSAGHESRSHMTGNARFAYPIKHIEADNRLSWLLGRLDEVIGDSAFYVHLQRDLIDTARSFAKRHDRGIMKAYKTDILMRSEIKNTNTDVLDYCIDYCNTVNSNIKLFLKDKTHKMDFHLETAERDFANFWEAIDAKGDYPNGLSEWKNNYNAS